MTSNERATLAKSSIFQITLYKYLHYDETPLIQKIPNSICYSYYALPYLLPVRISNNLDKSSSTNISHITYTYLAMPCGSLSTDTVDN